VTLTYRPRDIPNDGGLRPSDLTDFLKSLRYFSGKSFRYFACGEYGEYGPGHHPHFHLLLFGYDFPDKVSLGNSAKGFPQYCSRILDKAWKKGFANVSDFHWNNAQYCAGYVVKKITGDLADDHYRGLQPEFIRVSKMPGLGRDFLESNRDSIYEADCIRVGDKDYFIPKKFDEWTSEDCPDFWQAVKARRVLRRAERLQDVSEGAPASHEVPGSQERGICDV
jgi:hypothetical protein